MKAILTKLLVLLFVVSGFTQSEKELTRSVALNETELAFVMLPGDVELKEWDKSFVRVTSTVNVKNMNDNIVERLIMVGRYNIEAKEDKYGKMMIIKMPKVEHYVAVQGVDLVESYSFVIEAPEGYKVIVKEDLNPNAKSKSLTEQAI